MHLLDRVELERLGAYHRSDDRDRFLAGCLVAKAAVGYYVGCAPQDVHFVRTCSVCGKPHGKPRIVRPAGTALDISVSHSGDLVAVALVLSSRVGVDVEGVAARRSMTGLESILSPVERRALDSLPPARRADGLLVYWTRKEAILKALGVGLSLDPRHLVVAPPFQQARVVSAASEAAAAAQLFDLRPRDQHVAALAIIGSCERVREFDATHLLNRVWARERQRLVRGTAGRR